MIDFVLNALRTAESDREQAEYIILAKIQQLEDAIEAGQLYPHLPEAIMSHKKLVEFKNTRLKLQADFTENGEWTGGIDRAAGQIEKADKADYQPEVKTVIALTNLAVDKLKAVIKKGRQLRNEMLNQAEISAVGCIPSYKREGLMFVPGKASRQPVLNVHWYRLSVTTRYPTLRMTDMSTVIVRNQIMPDLQAAKQKITSNAEHDRTFAAYYVAADPEKPYESSHAATAQWLLAHHLQLT